MTEPAPQQTALSPEPLVSVLMTVRNGGPFLDVALKSLAAQTLASFEIIVVTNRADAATLDVLRRWSQSEPRLRLARLDSGGISRCANLAASMARAPYLARLDADDVAAPTRLEKQIAEFKCNPTLDLLGSAIEIIDARGQVVGLCRYPADHAAIVEEQRRLGAFTHSATMMRRSAFERIGGYRAGLRFSEDYDLWLRLSEHGRVGNLAEPLAQYRIHSNNMSITRVAAIMVSNFCVRASAVARMRHEQEPFIRDVPHLRRALEIEGADRASVRHRLVAGAVRNQMLWHLVQLPVPSSVRFWLRSLLAQARPGRVLARGMSMLRRV